MVLIHNYDDLSLKKIIIKKSCIHSEKFRTKDIKYKIKDLESKNYNFEDIYFQTPYLMLKYIPKIFEGNIDSKVSLDIPLKVNKSKERDKDRENQIDIESEKFCLLIKKIHKSLKTKLIKSESVKINSLKTFDEKVKNIKNKNREKYIDCLKNREEPTDDNYKNYIFKVKIHSLNNKPYIRIYNSNRKLCKQQQFKHNTLTRLILHLESIWYFEDSYGFNWYAVQAEMKLPNIPPSYFFYNEKELPIVDEEQTKENKNCLPEKYQKMINMGVPRIAVENKMKLDGYSINSSSIPAPPPLPPPLPTLSMLNSIKLNNVSENKKEKIEINKPKEDFRIPSLQQLKNQLNKLKKVEINKK
tara:strand:+ start:179 stop:1249 length:1071 start_codon:yes stop_codon:yes gene_type:complete